MKYPDPKLLDTRDESNNHVLYFKTWWFDCLYKDTSEFSALCVTPAPTAVSKRAIGADITHTAPSVWTKPATTEATITLNVLNVILPDGGLFISNERICFRHRRWRRYSAYQTVPSYLLGKEVVVKTKIISGGSKLGWKLMPRFHNRSRNPMSFMWGQGPGEGLCPSTEKD